MIKNKNQFIKALKEDKNKIKIKRIYNLLKNNKIPEGATATIKKVNSSSIILNYDIIPTKNIYVYFDNIEVKENKIYYYCLLEKNRLEEAKKIIKEDFNGQVKLFELSEKEKQKYNKYTNAEYTHKYINIINEIIETED